MSVPTYNYVRIDVPDEKFAESGAAWMAERIQKAITQTGSCVFGVSGGSTPGPVYLELGKMNLDWSKVTVFAVDERYTSPDSKDSNFNLTRSTLLQNAKIPENQVVFPNCSLPIDECVKDYEDRLKRLFAKHAPDFVTLGLGPDGHVASLFPPLTEELLRTQRLVMHTTTAMFAVFDRITLTPHALSLAKEHVFFLRGRDKLGLWEEMVTQPGVVQRWPGQAVLALGRSTLIVGV